MIYGTRALRGCAGPSFHSGSEAAVDTGVLVAQDRRPVVTVVARGMLGAVAQTLQAVGEVLELALLVTERRP